MSENGRSLIEAAAVALPTAVLAGIGWLAHTLVTTKKIPDYPELVGGILLSGFVAYAGVCLMMAMGMEASLAAPVASILGASGKDGFNYFLSKAKDR
jgi:hypothetical protein